MMTEKTSPLLDIGSKGLFIFADGVTIPQNQTLVVRGATPISELLLLGVDVASMYKKSGLTGMEQDVADDVLLYRLASETDWWYCPSRAILSFPSVTWVPYQRRIIGIDLGLLPSEESLYALTEALKEVVESELGIAPESVLATVTGDTLAYSEHEHQQTETQRKNTRKVAQTPTARLHRTIEQLNEANKTIRYLEQELLDK